MSRIFIRTLVSTVSVILLICGCKDKLADNFASPPETITTGVYWYWVNDNISKEGVVRDLQAMKRAGINSAYIGNIGGQPTPSGNAKLFTDDWWDVLHTTMKTAGELDIELGMFNCPGWSHSGGPWIKAEQSMRHLVASETPATGGKTVNIKLPVPQQPTQYKDWSDEFIDHEDKPSPHFQDIRTLAIPVPKDYRTNLFDAADVQVTTNNMRHRADIKPYRPVGNVPPHSPLAVRYIVPKREEASITLRLPYPQDARSLSIYPASHCHGEGELQAKVDGEFVTVAVYPLYRINPIPTVGFTPFAPTVVGFDRTTSDEYRIIFRNIERDALIGKIILSPSAVLDKYPEKTLARMHQRSNPAWTEYKWTSALDVPGGNDAETAIVPETIIDVTDKMQADGTLVWDAPEGDWLVLRMGLTPNEVFNSPASSEGRGWEMDKLNPVYIQYQFDNFLGEVLRRIPAADRKTFRVAIMDSWEKGAQTFSDNFIDALKDRYGYDPTPFLPVLTGHLVGSPEQSDRFLWDVRRLAAEMLADNLIPGFKAISRNHGIEIWIENYGGWGFPGEPMLYGKNSDRVGGEFWTDGSMHYIDLAASCAHIYNKPRVYAEAFTSRARYVHHPWTMKRDGDAAFAAGMTACVLHVYIQQAVEDKYPALDSWYGVEFNRKNAWFPHIDLFTTYLKRCGLMLEQGQPASDLAYFIGDDVPVNSGPFNFKPDAVKDSIVPPVLPRDYHFDYVNSDVIINRMSVKDGRIVLPHGVSYRLLVLPPFKTMRPEVLQSIERLVADGATVVGDAPQRSPSLREYPDADSIIVGLTAKMWRKGSSITNYGKGLILSGMTIQDALDKIQLTPDVKTDTNLVYAHRTAGDREIYFIANQSEQSIQTSPQFRIVGKQPELWHPVTGEIRPLTAFEYKDGNTVTVVPLQLEPRESVFIVFSGKGNPKSSKVKDNFPELKTIVEIASSWTVTFESDEIKDGPSEPVIFDRLQSWSLNDDKRIRYFSGTAVYTNAFELDCKPVGKIYIDLGKVGVMAKVKINGKYSGGAWTYPYRVNISDDVKTGVNTVEIEVVNTWNNRFVGESFLPPEERLVRPLYEKWTPDSPLVESGLLSPVKIVATCI